MQFRRKRKLVQMKCWHSTLQAYRTFHHLLLSAHSSLGSHQRSVLRRESYSRCGWLSKWHTYRILSLQYADRRSCLLLAINPTYFQCPSESVLLLREHLHPNWDFRRGSGSIACHHLWYTLESALSLLPSWFSTNQFCLFWGVRPAQ